MTKLIGLQYHFQYKKGVENKVADALPRVKHIPECQAIFGAHPLWIQEVLNSYAVDTQAQQLLTELAITGSNTQGFELVHSLIRKKGKIWVGANSALQTKLIIAFHNSAIGGHSGGQATYQRLKKLFMWAGLKQQVEEFVQQCAVCQQAKHEHCKYPGLLQPLPIPEGAWQEVCMDFIKGLPLSRGFDVILVVVDRFTKYAHFIPLKHPFTALQVAEVFLNNVTKLYGLPKIIVSDRDKVFTSAFWQALFKRFEVHLHLSSAYHPQSDGQTERVNQCLEMYLRCAVSNTPSKWCYWLPLAQYWYNTTFHTAIQCSPHKALYGVDPHHGILPSFALEDVDTSTSSSEADNLLKDRTFYASLLRHHLTRAQHRMKQAANANRTLRSFQVGDMVYLKLQPYAQHSVVSRPCPKLAMKYFGPFSIVSKIGSVAYKLQLPEASRIHPVFHVSQLKQVIPNNAPVFSTLPTSLELDVQSLSPSAILDRRMVKRGNAAVVQVKVRWGSLPEDFSTWEDYDVLCVRFPEVKSWGQDSSHGGGTVIAAAMTESKSKAEEKKKGKAE